MQLSKRILSTVTGTVFLLIACSSTPQPRAAIEDRSEYSKTVRAELQHWEKKEQRFTGAAAQDLRAMVADTRAELNRLDAAAEFEWKSYKPNVEGRLARIENNFSSRK